MKVMRNPPKFLGLILTCCLSVACGSDEDDNGDHDHAAAGSGGSGSTSSGSSNQAHEVTCTDESVKELTLFDKANPAKITEEAKTDGAFNTFIDATGGGVTPTTSFVYARFADDGLKRVDVSDEGAFESSDWDIAFRRYLIRLNSGVSGPSDVTGARTKPDTKFESLDSTPDSLEYRTEEYFTDSCEFINDGSGLPAAPATALSSFWSYSSCVAMTHNVYVVALEQPKERHVKLEVMSYYTPENQQVCDDTGKVPMSGSGSGNMRIRWAFLD
jgi:hypothetical protein